MLSGHDQYLNVLSSQDQYVIMLTGQGQYNIMLFFKNSIENEPILSRRYDCPESMLFFKNSIENEQILSRRYDCPESMLFFVWDTSLEKNTPDHVDNLDHDFRNYFELINWK